MTTALEKDLRRALKIKGADYVLTISPQGLKLTLKKKRNGLELKWADLVDGEAALATALNASLGRLDASGQDDEVITTSSKSGGRSRRVRKPR